MGNRPGRHTPLENAYSVADVQRTYRGAGPRRAGRRVHHHDRRLPLQPVRRGAPADARRARRGRAGPPGVPVDQLQRSVGDQQPRQGVLRGGRPGRGRRCRTASIAGGQRDRQGDARAAPHAHVRRSGGAARSTRWRTRPASASPRTWTRARSRPPAPRATAPRTRTTTRCTCRSCRCTTEGRAPVRLRINFLHMDTDPSAAHARRAAAQRVPVLRQRHGAHRRHRRVHRAAASAPTFLEAARRVARAGWRAEVHSLSATDFRTEIEGFETVNAETPIGDLRWVVAHVPFITRGLRRPVQGARRRPQPHRLAVPGRHGDGGRPAVPHDRRQRHPRRA